MVVGSGHPRGPGGVSTPPLTPPRAAELSFRDAIYTSLCFLVLQPGRIGPMPVVPPGPGRVGVGQPDSASARGVAQSGRAGLEGEINLRQIPKSTPARRWAHPAPRPVGWARRLGGVRAAFVLRHGRAARRCAFPRRQARYTVSKGVARWPLMPLRTASVIPSSSSTNYTTQRWSLRCAETISGKGTKLCTTP